MSDRKIEVKLTEGGKLEVDFHDFIAELTEQEKEDLIDRGGWWAFLYPAFMRDLRSQYAGPHYNRELYELRQMICTDDFLPDILVGFIKGLLAHTMHEIKSLQRYEKAYWRIYHNLMVNEEGKQFINDALEPYKSEYPKLEWIREMMKRFFEENNIVLDETPEDYKID